MIRSKVARFYEETNVRALIGWLIFISLIVAMEKDNYIFNPLVFGFGYYVLYTFSKMGGAAEDSLRLRLIFVGVIALLSLWTTVDLQTKRSDFIKAFEAICSDRSYGSNEQAQEVCEAIQMNIDETLFSNANYGAEDY